MKFNSHKLIIVAFIAVSCTTVTPEFQYEPTPTLGATISPVTSVPATYLLANESWSPSYPTCLIKSNIFYSVTPTAPASMSGDRRVELPNGLILQEYHNFGEAIHPTERGCWYSLRDRVHTSQIDLNNSFQIYIEALDSSNERVSVQQNNQIIYETEIRTFVYSGLLEAWGYEDHWVIEVMTQTGVDVIRDGKSLKEANGYERVFGFQLLSNKPFYLFRKYDGSFGFNFDGLETKLDYDDIPYTNPSPGMDPSILHYQNMIEFEALKDDVRFIVAVGDLLP